MKKTKDEIMTGLNALMGDNTSDEYLSFLSDLSDTLTETENEQSWEQKYEENDKAWRQKFKDTFINGTKNDDDDTADTQPKVYKTFESLFTTEG